MIRWRTALTLGPVILLLLAFWTAIASYATLWGLGLTDAFDWPVWQWWAYAFMRLPDPQGQAFLERWVDWGAIVATLFAAVCTYRMGAMALPRIKTAQAKALHGRSRFAEREDGERAGLIYRRVPVPGALILGKLGRHYVCLPGLEHVLLYAASMTGKGVTYVIPNCLNLLDSLVVLDLKCENYDATAGYRKEELEQEVFLFAPLAEDGRSHRWNPFDGITSDDERYISKLQQLCYAFFPPASGKEKFWQNGARLAFFGVCLLVLETPDAVLNVRNVLRFFVRADGYDTMVRLVEDSRKGLTGRRYSQICIDALSDFLRGEEAVVEGVRKDVSTALGLWLNPIVCAATETSDFSLRDLRRRKMTVYIGVMPPDIDQLGVLLSLFFLRLYHENSDVTLQQDPDLHHVHVLMDEFTKIPKMSPLAKATGDARGFGMHFSYVVQSKTAIKDLYFKDGESELLSNLGAEIVFATTDQNAVKEVSERAGTDTVRAWTWSAPRYFAWFRQKEQNETEREQGRRLLLPQEVERLPDDKELVFRRNSLPHLLDRFRWYEDPCFRNLRRSPPVAPRLVYVNELDDGEVKLQAPAFRKR